MEAPSGPRAHGPLAPLLRFPKSRAKGQSTWKSAVSNCWRTRSISIPWRHLIFSIKHLGPGRPGEARKGRGRSAACRTGPAARQVRFSTDRTCGDSEAHGGRRGWTGAWQRRPLDAEARDRKKEDVLRTASVGDGALGQMTSQAQNPKAHMAQQRMPSPTKGSHQHRTLCPSLLIPSLGGWELRAPRGEGMSLLSTFLPSQAARQLGPHQPGLALPPPHRGKAKALQGPWLGARHPN